MNNYLSRFFKSSSHWLVVILSLSSLLPTAYAAPKVVNSVIATVNNSVILDSEVNEMMTGIKKNSDPKNLPNDQELRHQIIERLITEDLILQEATRLNIKVSEQDVANYIAQIAKENNMTLAQLKSRISGMGIAFSSYQNRLRRDMTIDQARMSVLRQRIRISDAEINKVAEMVAKQPTDNVEVNISHILIGLPENPSQQDLATAEGKVKTIMSRLKQGDSFAKLAITYSSDELALNGGNVGWRRIQELPELFENYLIRAQAGQIIGPIRSNVGFHIVRVDGARGETRKPITVQEYNARHILIKTNVLVNDTAAKNKLEQILQSINSGATSFEAAARSYSEDPGSAEKGGALGWSIPDRYDANFAQTLIKLKKGEISAPIKSAYGWHIIQLVDSRSVDKTESAQKDQAYRIIFNRKFAEELQIWVQELRSDAYIRINDGN